MTCPLCLSSAISLYHKDQFRSYQLCGECSLVFVPRDQLVSLEAEKERYDAHENNENDPGYEKYLKNVVNSLLPHLSPSSHGLDFGCGRSKLLEKLLTKEGHCVSSYDVFFHRDENLFSKRYDFIIMSEVIEHLRNPHEEMRRVKGLLKQAANLFIKTKLLPDSTEKFSNWFYKRDSTHIQFFGPRSLNKLKERYGFDEYQEVGEDLFLFRNN
ncbi:MAG: class I SAM-dependent methyltransferase [Bacteriovoracia bacterium]